jgi:hypothetical protein
MSQHAPIEIDLISEGPDAECIGLADLVVNAAKKFDYNLNNLLLTTNNLVQKSLPFSVTRLEPAHFVVNTRKLEFVKKNITKHFGMFIGRSNIHRLYLSSHLWNHCLNQTIQTFHYNNTNNFHQANLGLNELVNHYGTDQLDEVAKFLKHAPICIDQVSYPILMSQHCNIVDSYKNFFVEIVCESYFSGATFFPTEKTWRAIATGTPFITQGPENYLKRLHHLGFKTFGKYWPEGYSDDPAEHQPNEIINIINRLSAMTVIELESMYQDMLPILHHNRQQLQELTNEELLNVK